MATAAERAERNERNERIGFRVTSAQKEVLAKAAALTGEGVTSFVLSRALHDARSIVQSEQVTIIAARAAADYQAWLDDERPREIAEMSKRLRHIEPLPVAGR